MTYQFKIKIEDIANPPVWRRITIPSHFTFLDLHYAIQVAFDWENAHLFQFSPKGYASYPQIKSKEEDDNESFFMDHGETLNAEKTKLSDIFYAEGQKFTYIYDFGDDWFHGIILEKILPEKTMYPCCLAGKGKCPPEDCGGAWAYDQLKEILSDKNHPEYEEYAEWCGLSEGEKWDPAEFDLKKVQKYLSQFFKSNPF